MTWLTHSTLSASFSIAIPKYRFLLNSSLFFLSCSLLDTLSKAKQLPIRHDGDGIFFSPRFYFLSFPYISTTRLDSPRLASVEYVTFNIWKRFRTHPTTTNRHRTLVFEKAWNVRNKNRFLCGERLGGVLYCHLHQISTTNKNPRMGVWPFSHLARLRILRIGEPIFTQFLSSTRQRNIFKKMYS